MASLEVRDKVIANAAPDRSISAQSAISFETASASSTNHAALSSNCLSVRKSDPLAIDQNTVAIKDH